MTNQRDQAKMLAFVLWNEFNAKQVSIARVLGVSEPTVSLWLKEMRFRNQVEKITDGLDEARTIAKKLQLNGLIEYRQKFDLFRI